MLREGIKKPEDIKIHTYVICKNEGKFVEGFLETVKDTNTLAAMDTGSSDNTYELFKQAAEKPEWKGRLFVWQQEVKPWRFDVARNLSMQKMPEDTDYCFCIDLDERLEPGFFQKLRERIFELGYIPERIFYTYCWSHNADGSPNYQFAYDKTHGPKGWKWEYDCHEALILDPQYASLYGPSVNIDDMKKIWLHHWPDPTKSRGSYLGLLRNRMEHYPDDPYGVYYLAREEFFNGNHEVSMSLFNRLYSRLCQKDATDDMLMKPMVALNLAEEYAALNMDEEAEFYYKKAIEHDKRLIDSYIKYAQWLAYHGRPGESLSIIREGRKNMVIVHDWRSVPCLGTKWKTEQVVADCLCWLEEYEIAWEIISKAKEEVESSGWINDAHVQGFYNDYDFIRNKLGITE